MAGTIGDMSVALAICAGIALAAACGFRVFVPLLAASLAVHFGYLSPSASMSWIGSPAAMIILGVATVVEVLAYYVPWVDHALDMIASPAAVMAGTLVAATAFGNIDPALKWALALIAGGGAAAIFQGGSVLTRAASTATTGGLGNPIVSTIEAAGAIILSVLAILLPVLAILLLLMLGVCMVVLYRWWKARKCRSGPPMAAA